MIAIFLVGGLGTRLRPFTHEKPKALMPVINRPFISYQFDLLKNTPVTHIVLAAGKGHALWEKEIKTCAGNQFKVQFVYEKELLGTGGAIRLAYDRADRRSATSTPVLVFNGDVFFDVDINKLLHFHTLSQAMATVSLTLVKDPSRFGLVVMNKKGEIKKFIEKPNFKMKENFVNGGIYVLDPAFIRYIPKKRVVSVERDSFPSVLKGGHTIMGFKTKGYWNDIGTPQTYLKAHSDLLNTHPDWTDAKYLRKRGGPKVVFGKKVQLGKDVQFEGFISIGDGVRLKRGCKIVNSVLHDSVVVQERAEIANSIVGRKCVIGHHSIVSDNSFLGPQSVIYPYSKI